MRFVFFTHSLVSDWNHGNAHFLRGVMSELIVRGHDAEAWEPKDGWSRTHLREEAPGAERAFRARFPELRSREYRHPRDLDEALDGTDVLIVHEWTDPAVVAEIGRRRAAGGRFRLFFHDTHHRAASAPDELAAIDLSAYDGVLAFGETLRELWLARGWGRHVWTWHEAADTRVFRPRPEIEPESDVVWVGNWGDGERADEISTFLIEPCVAADARLDVHGVRYPEEALSRLERSGARYHGWVANADVPEVFARHRMTFHVPRRFYVEALPGVPTIRVFEALACGIPLISAPWDDCEGLFRPGDFLRARDGEAAARQIRAVLDDPHLAAAVAARGLETIEARHSCAHRVDELFAILSSLGVTMADRRLTA